MRKRSIFGWIELILGILFIMLGILVLRNPGTALSGFVLIYGIAALVTGIADIFFYIRMDRRTGFGPASSLVGGILNIIISILLLLNIQAGALVFTLLFPLWIIIHSISRLSNIGFIRLIAGNVLYWCSLIISILGIFAGIILIFNPFASAVSLVYFISLYLFILGIGSIISAFSRLGEGR
ncbi:DUF308 domain-containing protein [Treponema sp. OttesenSCG-928-L16]|nr:DUF308 domain-containing protein [Treponema sp. OttesenSCG-928-L16]